MAIAVTHTTQAAGTDAGNGEIGKEAWNEAHQLTMTTGKLLGRSTAGDGAVEELAIGSGLSLSGNTLSATGGGGTPGGADTQVQFNDGGVLGADAGLTFNKATGALTVGGKTLTASAPALDVSQTWNNAAVTFTGLKFNVTATASAAESLLLDFQVGGTTRFKIDKNGVAYAGSGARVCVMGGITGNRYAGVYRNTAFQYGFGVDDSDRCFVGNGAGSLRALSLLSIGFGASGVGTEDLVIARDAANALAQRNGTNAQIHRVYGTYTDASNYRRLTKTMSAAGVAEIKPEGAGTGSSGNVLHISGLPTANPGAGILWNDAGTVKVGT